MKDEPQSVLIGTALVRRFFGDVSDMWIVRRLKTDSAFPRPIYLGRRRFWRRVELEEYVLQKANNSTARNNRHMTKTD